MPCEKRDSVSDRLHGDSLLVGNLHAKRFLECHHQLDTIEAVRAKLLPGFSKLDTVGSNPKLFSDDRSHLPLYLSDRDFRCWRR